MPDEKPWIEGALAGPLRSCSEQQIQAKATSLLKVHSWHTSGPPWEPTTCPWDPGRCRTCPTRADHCPNLEVTGSAPKKPTCPPGP